MSDAIWNTANPGVCIRLVQIKDDRQVCNNDIFEFAFHPTVSGLQMQLLGFKNGLSTYS